MIRSAAPSNNDRYGGHEAAICPSADRLRATTPRGARALRCWVPGAHKEEVVLPLTQPDQRRPLPGGGSWIAMRLGELLPGRSEESIEGRADLATMLAPGPSRSDGLPAYWPAEPNVGFALARILSVTLRGKRTLRIPQNFHGLTIWTVLDNKTDSGRGQRGPRYDGRGLLAAVAVDLLTVSREAVSIELLGLGDTDLLPQHDSARQLSRYLVRGRQLLSGLGVWPWVHSGASGRLPTVWASSRAFLEPLEGWQRLSAEEAADEAA